MLTRLVMLLALTLQPTLLGALSSCPVGAASQQSCAPTSASESCCCCAPAAEEPDGCCATTDIASERHTRTGPCPCARPTNAPASTQAVDRSQQKSETITPAGAAPARSWGHAAAMRPVRSSHEPTVCAGPSLPVLCRWQT